jgi:hypothetical protein
VPTLVNLPEPSAPALSTAVDAFVAAHTAAAPLPAGATTTVRETLAKVIPEFQDGAELVATLATPDGDRRLAGAFAVAFGDLAAADHAHHLTALRMAITWWRARGWLDRDPTRNWRPEELTAGAIPSRGSAAESCPHPAFRVGIGHERDSCG